MRDLKTVTVSFNEPPHGEGLLGGELVPLNCESNNRAPPQTLRLGRAPRLPSSEKHLRGASSPRTRWGLKQKTKRVTAQWPPADTDKILLNQVLLPLSFFHIRWSSLKITADVYVGGCNRISNVALPPWGQGVLLWSRGCFCVGGCCPWSGRQRKRMRWLDGIPNAMHMSLSKLREMVKDMGASRAAVHRVAKSQTCLSNWTTTTGGRGGREGTAGPVSAQDPSLCPGPRAQPVRCREDPRSCI